MIAVKVGEYKIESKNGSDLTWYGQLDGNHAMMIVWGWQSNKSKL